MTFNHIYYFLECAKCLNFSEAARNLFMTQPALGRQITALEKELNMQLFFRSTHGMKLTPAGKYLQKELGECMERFSFAIEQAKVISKGYAGKLVLGVLDGIDVSLFLADLVSEFEERYPEIQLYLKRYSFRQLREKLFNNELDAIITQSMDIEKREGISSVNILKLHPAIAVPVLNPLAKKENLHWRDLKDQELVITNEDECTFGVTKITEDCKKYGGFYPRLFFSDTVEDCLLQVESGSKCAIINMEMTIAKSENIKMFPLMEADHDTYFVFAWKDDHLNFSLELMRNLIQ